MLHHAPVRGVAATVLQLCAMQQAAQFRRAHTAASLLVLARTSSSNAESGTSAGSRRPTSTAPSSMLCVSAHLLPARSPRTTPVP